MFGRIQISKVSRGFPWLYPWIDFHVSSLYLFLLVGRALWFPHWMVFFSIWKHLALFTSYLHFPLAHCLFLLTRKSQRTLRLYFFSLNIYVQWLICWWNDVQSNIKTNKNDWKLLRYCNKCGSWSYTWPPHKEKRIIFAGTKYFNRSVRILRDLYDLCISRLLWFLFFVVFVCLFFLFCFLQFKGKKIVRDTPRNPKLLES